MALQALLASEPRAAVRSDLRPYPGRAAFALRIALVCALTTIACMALGTPEAAIACYLVFFATREDAAASVSMALKLIVGASAGIAIGLVFLMGSADEPIARMALMVAFTFGGMFFAHASSLGPIASTVGFVLALGVTLFDQVPVPELLVRGMLYLWQVVAVPMTLVIAVNAIAGPRAHEKLRGVIVERLETAAALLAREPDAAARARAVLGADAAQTRERRKTAYLFFSAGARERARLETLLDASYEMLASCKAQASRFGEGARDAALAARCRSVAAAIASSEPFQPPSDDDDAYAFAPTPILRRIEWAASPRFDGSAPVAVKEPLLAADAFTNPDHVRFALKTTLAAFICYAAYTALDWFGIHTALVTCYFVALSSVGETIHKLTLRIVGCLIGALLGLVAMIVLMPHMTDVGQLALLVGVVSFGAAWISAGSQRISYMGWQIALAFFLCVLQDFGPGFDLTVARDRILGILLGNLVMTVVFSTVWPVGVDRAIGRWVAKAARALADFTRAPTSRAGRIEAFHVALGEARRIGELSLFESRSVAFDAKALDSARSVGRGLARVSAPMVLLAESCEGDVLAPYLTPQAQAAADRFERAAVDWLSDFAIRIETGLGLSPPPWIGAPDETLDAVSACALPMSAVVALGRQYDLYRGVSEGINRLEGAG